MTSRPWYFGGTALVTGATSGIGHALTLRLLGEGMTVFGVARRLRDPVDDKPVRSIFGKYKSIQADLRNERELVDAFDRALKEAGSVNVLVNSAGVGYEGGLTEALPKEWREMWEINVQALSLLNALMAQHVQNKKHKAAIVNVGSLGGHRLAAGGAMYSATKYAVRVLTEALRRELLNVAPSTRVLSVSPGYVDTNFAARFHHTPNGKGPPRKDFPVLTADDVAGAIMFALDQPERVQIHDIILRPARQET